ncbi:MAG: hypothetical protein R2836_06435 [Chitinophagales bacterium]
MGLVDEVCNHSKLHSVATQICQKIMNGKWKRPEKLSLMDKFLDHTSIGNNIVFNQAKKSKCKANAGQLSCYSCYYRLYRNGH